MEEDSNKKEAVLKVRQPQLFINYQLSIVN